MNDTLLADSDFAQTDQMVLEPTLRDFDGEIISYRHRLQDDSSLTIREAIPENREAELMGTIVIFHGLSQIANAGPSAAFQEVVSQNNLDKRVVAIENDFMSLDEQELNPFSNRTEYFGATLQKAAEKRLEYLIDISSDENPITIVGTSMGSVITVLALELAKQKGIKLNIDNIIFNDSAVVTEKRGARTLLSFPLHMVPAVTLEFATTNPRNWPEMAQVGIQAATEVGRKDFTAMSRQIYDLVFGDSYHDESKLIEIFLAFPDTNFTFLSGVIDPLRKPHVYSAIAKLLPNVHVKRVGLAGHGRQVNFRKAAAEVDLVLAKYDASYREAQAKRRELMATVAA